MYGQRTNRVKGCVIHHHRMESFRDLRAMKRLRFFLLVLSPVLLCSLLWAQTDSFKIIVHASNPVTSMTRDEISKLFLKKEVRWGHGFRVTPVDQVLDSPTGAAFAMAVHGKDAKEIKAYWIKVVFSGLGTPPMELRSDEEVLDFVRHNVGGIGYVSSGAAIGEGVKVLSMSD
jgi:ABC-type phosphate transport system substrate-binding protein